MRHIKSGISALWLTLALLLAGGGSASAAACSALDTGIAVARIHVADDSDGVLRGGDVEAALSVVVFRSILTGGGSARGNCL